MRLAALTLVAAALPCAAQEQREIQRALIQRDQQSAEFAAGVRGTDRGALEALHSRQLRDVGRGLSPDPVVAREMQGYERQTMANERELRLSPPVVRAPPRPPEAPLPLPGGLQHGVEPITPQSTRD